MKSSVDRENDFHDVRQSFQNVPLLALHWGPNRLPSLNVAH